MSYKDYNTYLNEQFVFQKPHVLYVLCALLSHRLFVPISLVCISAFIFNKWYNYTHVTAVYMIFKVVRNHEDGLASECRLGSLKAKWESRFLRSAHCHGLFKS